MQLNLLDFGLEVQISELDKLTKEVMKKSKLGDIYQEIY